MIPIRLFIDAVIRTATEDGVAVYVVHSGDMERGNIFVKTTGDNGLFYIHQRVYDFINDTYTWETTPYTDEKFADTTLRTHYQQDTDCWCIDIDSPKNYFADIL